MQKKPPSRTKNIFLYLLFASLIFFSVGCASLPDVGPFADASNNLKASVSAAGESVGAELRLMDGGSSYADSLASQWEKRNTAFAGMADYSSSLVVIVASGNDGAASADRVATSLQKLAGSAGIALPASSEGVALATDIGKYVYAQIAIARAAKSLEEAMTSAQPIVDSVAALIASDFKDLEEIFIAANADVDIQLRRKFNDSLSFRNNLLSQLQTANLSDGRDLEKEVRITQLLAGTEPIYHEYLNARKLVNDRLRAGRALIHTARQSSHEWAAAHSNIRTALSERRPVNTESLIQSSLEIKGLIQRLRMI